MTGDPCSTARRPCRSAVNQEWLVWGIRHNLIGEIRDVLTPSSLAIVFEPRAINRRTAP